MSLVSWPPASNAIPAAAGSPLVKSTFRVSSSPDPSIVIGSRPAVSWSRIRVEFERTSVLAPFRVMSNVSAVVSSASPRASSVIRSPVLPVMVMVGSAPVSRNSPEPTLVSVLPVTVAVSVEPTADVFPTRMPVWKSSIVLLVSVLLYVCAPTRSMNRIPVMPVPESLAMLFPLTVTLSASTLTPENNKPRMRLSVTLMFVPGPSLM